MKTRAAVLRVVGGPLSIEELEVPSLQKGQVLIKVLATGLCHSQLNEIRGRKGAEYIPHLLGHEAAAEVVAAGEGVQKVRSGDYVVASWILGEGISAPVPTYQSKEGKVNGGSVATFTELAVVSENRVTKVSKGVEPAIAALLGCAVPTGMGIIDRLGDLNGKRVVIFGIGGIGASALIRAVMKGAHVTAIDVVPWKLAHAKKELGVDEAISAEEFQGKDFDVAVECSGNKGAMESAYRAVKDAGTVVIAGNLAPGETISINPFGLIKGKKLYGTWGGESELDRDIPRYAREYVENPKVMCLDKLLTKEYSFDEIGAALKDLEEGKLIRGVLTTL